jgi:hypothetical protein
VTASRFDPVLLLLAALAACRGGLPPEPPGADPADTRAGAPAYQAPANPYETSAFVDEKPASATDHGAMDHSWHSMKQAPAAPHAGHKPEAPR